MRNFDFKSYVCKVYRHPKSRFVMNETHYFDNGKNLLIDSIQKFFLTEGFHYRKIAVTTLFREYKLETNSGTIKLPPGTRLWALND